jgi:inorganic pyrophosphatase
MPTPCDFACSDYRDGNGQDTPTSSRKEQTTSVRCYRGMRPIDKISLMVPGGYNVVVETPRGSRTKFAYDPETGLFRAKKLLAMGFAFPFPFGFFPSTQAEDGDPLDVLLLTDAELPMGSLVRCRLLGGIAMEEASEGKTQRNDRLLAVPLLLHQDRPPYELSDLPEAQLKDLEDFFVAYKLADGRQAKAVGRFDRSKAEDFLRKAAQP